MSQGDGILITVRFIHFTTAMLLSGASLFPYYAGAWVAFPRRLMVATAWIAAGSWVAWLLCEAVSMSGNTTAWASPHILAKVLEHTQFGHIWQWRAGLLALLAGLVLLRQQRKGLICIVSALCTLTLAGVGHGDMGIGNDVWLHLGNQAIHILSASVWLGGLAGLINVIWNDPEHHAIEIVLQRFSLAGTVTVLLIVGTGLINAWFLVGSLHALLHTGYGQVLLVKLAFFLAMVALALINRFVLMPRLAGSTDVRRARLLLLRSIAAEQVFAILAVAAVSVLGTMTPGFGMQGMGM